MLAVLATSSGPIQLRQGNAYPLTFTDVDHHQLSTADGHVTVISVVTRRDEAKAQTLGDRVSKITFGDPKFRLVTVVNFQQNILPPFRGIASAVNRHRLPAASTAMHKS